MHSGRRKQSLYDGRPHSKSATTNRQLKSYEAPKEGRGVSDGKNKKQIVAETEGITGPLM